ncbi:MAG: hypothetical protein LUD27_01565 [Clostridia bacterium]|nr:hypothetical protein [Clostridia bacterium]
MKIKKIGVIFLVPLVFVSLAGCKKDVGENSGYVLQDTSVYPAVTAPYESESQAALDEYFAVAEKYTDSGGDVDRDNSYVQAAAKTAAAKLYAYACYNEEYLDKYVYFSDQTGTTKLSSGTSKATKQDYKLIIHESETVCGYKYHYTIKKVDSATGSLSLLTSAFESCRLRFVEAETNCLYRFNGDDVEYVEVDGTDYLTCIWNIDTSQDGGWGTSEDEPAVVKRSGDKLTLDEIAEDIVSTAATDPSNSVIHGNINVFAEDLFSDARIIPYEEDGVTRYIVSTEINIDKANADESSISMLEQSNGTDEGACTWCGDTFTLAFVLWDNGLFYQYRICETWTGKISGISGSTVNSDTTVVYSYSDADTDMTAKLEMLENAKDIYNG